MWPSTLGRDVFVARFGAVYEASLWVAGAVWPLAAVGALDDPEAMARAMRDTVDSAPRERRLALIRAHPQLAVASSMAEASVREQRGAGLDQCAPEELAAFQSLNAAYLARFGFPFVIAVKGLSRADILAAFAARLENAMDEIHRIAGFRVAALLTPG